MAQNLVEYKRFAGLNTRDSVHRIWESSHASAALNVDVGLDFVETTPGYDLFNEDTSKTGGIKYIMPYYGANGTTKQLMFMHDDDVYYLDISAAVATDAAWQTVGDYGTATNNPSMIVYDDTVIIGGGGTNELKKWTGSAFTAVTNQPVASNGINIFEIYEGRDFKSVFGVKEGTNTVYYPVPGSPDDWTGATSGNLVIGKNDGDGVWGLKAQGQYMWVIKERRKYPVEIVYDTAGLAYLPDVGQRTDSSGGTIAANSCQVVTRRDFSDDIHMLTRQDGISSFGRPSGFNDALVSYSVSELINNLLYTNINWSYKDKARAVAWERKYMCAVPFLAAQSNSGVIVEHLDSNDFTIYDHINVGCYAKVKLSDGLEYLLVGDADEPKIYKFNKDRYDVDNNGYTRKYRTGKITFDGLYNIKDGLQWIDISGAIKIGTTIYVKLISRSE